MEHSKTVGEPSVEAIRSLLNSVAKYTNTDKAKVVNEVVKSLMIGKPEKAIPSVVDYEKRKNVFRDRICEAGGAGAMGQFVTETKIPASVLLERLEAKGISPQRAYESIRSLDNMLVQHPMKIHLIKWMD